MENLELNKMCLHRQYTKLVIYFPANENEMKKRKRKIHRQTGRLTDRDTEREAERERKGKKKQKEFTN